MKVLRLAHHDLARFRLGNSAIRPRTGLLACGHEAVDHLEQPTSELVERGELSVTRRVELVLDASSKVMRWL
eukprot:CAMPEP_0205929848 /NCGR_PEP_ID=MMETSP1325-20131115/25544_1 /ASSEMBLY_ACC=CAM_ASM_000708 /TAXON_ID=236786 /ORGANISM="Florenciella sp., Strain RCC1007" /LENGTH=71 /DNA_ID=CAMNT_0053299121 /DNA_START=127 /DNA_END=340 /DNA_ORIENTATION=+